MCCSWFPSKVAKPRPNQDHQCDEGSRDQRNPPWKLNQRRNRAQNQDAERGKRTLIDQEETDHKIGIQRGEIELNRRRRIDHRCRKGKSNPSEHWIKMEKKKSNPIEHKIDVGTMAKEAEETCDSI